MAIIKLEKLFEWKKYNPQPRDERLVITITKSCASGIIRSKRRKTSSLLRGPFDVRRLRRAERKCLHKRIDKSGKWLLKSVDILRAEPDY